MNEEWTPKIGQEPPPLTAEEADWENKAAVVEDFVRLTKELSEAIDELVAVLPIKDNAFDELRDALWKATELFDPDMDDGRSLEDLS